jgi:hypothetical protein
MPPFLFKIKKAYAIAQAFKVLTKTKITTFRAWLDFNFQPQYALISDSGPLPELASKKLVSLHEQKTINHYNQNLQRKYIHIMIIYNM